MTERAYVIGDLHLGAGPDDPLEDFFQDEAFARFCERIAGPETTLVLNGDIVDFAQIAPFDVPKAAHLLWPAKASLQKLETALAAHPAFFLGLRGLLDKGGRIRFLLGNHDLDMIWPAVQDRVREALGAPEAARLAFDVGAHVFHGVHIEHGHHFTPENCPRDPGAFLHAGPDGEPYLERVWGTDFMLRFYNALEHDHPYADNVKPMLTVVWNGLRKGWIGASELVRLFVFLKQRGVPWTGLTSAVLDGPGSLSVASAAAAFDDVAWKQAVLDRGRADPTFTAELQRALDALEPEERRLATTPTRIEIVDPVAQVDPATAGGGATLGLFREDRQLRAARDRLKIPGVTHVVFGHSHEAVDGALDGRLYNYGTWLPSLDLKRPELRKKIADEGITLDLLKDSTLYAIERRVVRIDGDPVSKARVELVSADAP